MLEVREDSCPLREFADRPEELLKQLQKSGEPLVLTVKGKPALVVQDAGAYQRIVDLLDRWDAIEGIRMGLEDVKQGRVLSAKEAFQQLRQKHDYLKNT